MRLEELIKAIWHLNAGVELGLYIVVHGDPVNISHTTQHLLQINLIIV